MKAHVELDKNRELLVTGFNKFASSSLYGFFTLTFFLVLLLTGLWTTDYFMQAVAPRIISAIIGFMFTLISSIVAIIIALFIPDKREFLSEVIDLYHQNDYRMAITFVVLLLPISRYLTRTLNRLITSYSSRNLVFAVLCCVSGVCMISLITYLSAKEYWPAYAFSFSVAGLIFLLLHIETKGKELSTRNFIYENDPLISRYQ
jgi:hypothetical protein